MSSMNTGNQGVQTNIQTGVDPNLFARLVQTLESREAREAGPPPQSASTQSPVSRFFGKKGTIADLKGEAGADFISPKMIMGLLEASPATTLALGLSHFMSSGVKIPMTSLSIPGPMQNLAVGQISGQGQQAGAKAYIHALSMGSNPYDNLSVQTSMEIEKATREQGFSGKQANDISSASASLVRSLGLDYTAAVNLVTQNVRHGTMSLKDFTTTMTSLKGIAHDSGQSVQTLTEDLGTFVTNVTNIGGKTTATPATDFYAAVQKALPQFASKGAPSSVVDFLTKMAPQLTTLGGGSPIKAFTAGAIKNQWAPGLQNYINRFMKSKPAGMSTSDYVEEMTQTGTTETLFPGLSADQINQLLGKGGGSFLKSYGLGKQALLPTTPKGGKSLLSNLFGEIYDKNSPANKWVSAEGPKLGQKFTNANNYLTHNILGFPSFLKPNAQSQKSKTQSLYDTVASLYSKQLADQLVSPLFKDVGTSGFNKAFNQVEVTVKLETTPEFKRTFKPTVVARKVRAIGATGTAAKSTTGSATNTYRVSKK